MTQPRVAIVSDTCDDINGVAVGLRRLVATARRAGYPINLVGPARSVSVMGHSPSLGDDVVRIASALTASLPFYPSMAWSVPELPPLVRWLASSANLVQLATPGPMGLGGLIAGRMLGLPVIAQYHTEVAEYAARMTGIPLLRDIVAPIVGWFYRQADLCLAPSDTVARRLVALGVPEDRIVHVQRGVDLRLFDPARRDRARLARYGVGDGPVALYVGRLSREKNLGALNAAWAIVRRARPEAQLVVVGEGPQPDAVRGPGVVATGPLFGEELAGVFASADAFAFPSETETFGNVVVEAAASGLPAVVASAGASHEHVLDGITGYVVDGSKPAAIAAALIRVLDDPVRRRGMAVASRMHAAKYDLDNAVRATWDIYRGVMRRRAVLEAAA